jgi:hypothetical protein
MEVVADYLGMFGYNENPQALGEPHGFWRFATYDEFETALERAQALDVVFTDLGAPTYSHYILGINARGQVVLHLLVIAIQPIYARQYDLLDQFLAWLADTEQRAVPFVKIAGVLRECLVAAALKGGV